MTEIGKGEKNQETWKITTGNSPWKTLLIKFQKEVMKLSKKSFKKIPQTKMSPDWKVHQILANNFLKN